MENLTINQKILTSNLKSKIMTNYEVTIGYKAVISINVKAESEEDAKVMAVDIMRQRRDKMPNYKCFIQDDNFEADGIINMDATWNQLNY